MLKHSQLQIKNDSIHIAEAGSPQNLPILFLHGWPENWQAFENILELAGKDFYALAVDLPGIGLSEVNNPPAEKKDIAEYVHNIVSVLGLKKIILAGHDVGGQVTYSYLQNYPGELAGAVIMNVVVPGVDPWTDVVKNPNIWHFQFHKIPALPDNMVEGKERKYFDYFYDILSAHPDKISTSAREAYAKAYSDGVSLKTGFNWYRAFDEDAKYNLQKIKTGQENGVPLLYIRGDKDPGNIEKYTQGFQTAGAKEVYCSVISDCGHFSPEEQPEQVWKTINSFIRKII